MAKLLVFTTGLFFIFYGTAFTFFPVEMASFVTDGSPSTPSGLIDMRATYGGMSAALGITILIFATRSDLVSTGLLIVTVVLLAMASTRILGLILDGSANLVMCIYLAAELVFASLALYLRKSIQGEKNA